MCGDRGAECAGCVQVLFLVRAAKANDMEFLDELVGMHPSAYEKVLPKDTTTFQSFYDLLDANQIYVKMDDDIVFIAVSSPHDHKHALSINGNFLNKERRDIIH